MITAQPMLSSLQPIPFSGLENSPAVSAQGASGLELFFSRNPQPMWVFDPVTMWFLAANDAAIRQYGWTRGEFLTMRVDQVMPAYALNEFRALIGALGGRTGGVASAKGLHHVSKTGSALRVDSVWQLAEFNGRAAVYETIIDRTEQIELAQENHELSEVLNLASDAIIVCDLEHEIVFWNHGATKIYGWPPEEACGKKVDEMLGFDPEAVRSGTFALLEKGSWTTQNTHVRKDGTRVVVNSRWTLVRDQKTGRPKEVLLINSDITETKKLESQFLRAQRLESLGTLASGLAHDLNNILSPILMASCVLGQSDLRPEDRKMLAIIDSSAERGAGIVKQVLSFARGADGERVPIQTRHIIQDMAKVMVQTFPRNIDVQTSIPRDPWMITGDATQIHQILLNLCVNARDAIGEKGGMIRIVVANIEVDQQLASMHPGAQLGPHVCISVTDTGSGMTPEVMEKIFDPFFTTKEQGKGTGLGLATVIGIVKGHRGFLTLHSQVGVGTTFRVHIPANVEAREGGQGEQQPEVVQGNGETLLVVDDEATIREAIVTTLRSYGYNCYTAEDGTDALALFFERKDIISAVITDLHMCVMDGIELVRALRKIAPATKVVVSSGHISDEKRTILNGLQISGILEKPYTAERLLRCVQELLGTPEARR